MVLERSESTIRGCRTHAPLRHEIVIQYRRDAPINTTKAGLKGRFLHFSTFLQTKWRRNKLLVCRLLVYMQAKSPPKIASSCIKHGFCANFCLICTKFSRPNHHKYPIRSVFLPKSSYSGFRTIERTVICEPQAPRLNEAWRREHFDHLAL